LKNDKKSDFLIIGIDKKEVILLLFTKKYSFAVKGVNLIKRDKTKGIVTDKSIKEALIDGKRIRRDFIEV
jgi:hypothetical protein